MIVIHLLIVFGNAKNAPFEILLLLGHHGFYAYIQNGKILQIHKYY